MALRRADSVVLSASPFRSLAIALAVVVGEMSNVALAPSIEIFLVVLPATGVVI